MKLQSFREVQLAFVFINLLQGLVTFLTIKQCSLSRNAMQLMRLCGASKCFMKALKSFIKPPEVRQRSAKIKI